jgi:hypothetical protein
MKKVIYLLSTLLLLSLTQCKKDSSASLSLERKLTGKWLYTGSSGGIDGRIQAADSSSPVVLEFKNNLAFVKTENGVVKAQGTYKLLKAHSIYSGKEEDAILFNDKEGQMNNNFIINVDGDKLSIADNFYDGYTQGFKRP